jgi:hypothetical protein
MRDSCKGFLDTDYAHFEHWVQRHVLVNCGTVTLEPELSERYEVVIYAHELVFPVMRVEKHDNEWPFGVEISLDAVLYPYGEDLELDYRARNCLRGEWVWMHIVEVASDSLEVNLVCWTPDAIARCYYNDFVRVYADYWGKAGKLRWGERPEDSPYGGENTLSLAVPPDEEEKPQSRVPPTSANPTDDAMLRLHIEGIDSFAKVRDVQPGEVQDLLRDGYLDVSEDFIQSGLEKVLNVPSHKKDWAGETDDLYTSNTVVGGNRVPTAFLLKGNGLQRKELRIKDCGKNGDQLVRLFEAPADLFVVQFVGGITAAVIKDVQSKANERRSRGEPARFCIMDGQDTARLFHAYGLL